MTALRKAVCVSVPPQELEAFGLAQIRLGNLCSHITDCLCQKSKNQDAWETTSDTPLAVQPGLSRSGTARTKPVAGRKTGKRIGPQFMTVSSARAMKITGAFLWREELITNKGNPKTGHDIFQPS